MLSRPQFNRVRRDPLGPEPGTSEVPAGHVRMFHYTAGENLESLATEGIQLRKAVGDTYGEPNAVWGSTRKPDGGHFVEAHIPYHEYEPGAIGLPDAWHAERSSDAGIAKFNSEDHNFALGQDVPASRIVARSSPALETTRYIEKDGGVPGGESAVAHWGSGLEGTAEHAGLELYDQRHPRPSRTLVSRPDQRNV